MSLRPPALTLAASLLFLALAAPGCADDEQSGTLTVNYVFGPDRSCEQEGVSEVRVTLTSGSTVFEEQASCDTEDGVLLEQVKAGNYELLVEGLDGVGDTIRDNLGMPETDEAVEVLGGASTTMEVSLSPTPATIRFLFEVLDADGHFQQCAASDIKFFAAEAFRASQQMASHTFDYCEASGKVPMPDPDRKIEGDLLDGVRVRPLDATDQPVGSGVDFTFDPPGAGKTIDLIVTCMGTDCTGEVEGVGSGGDAGTAGGTGGADTGSGTSADSGTGG